MIGGTETMATNQEYHNQWQKENTLTFTVRINKNQDPELFELINGCKGPKGSLIRSLLQKGLDYEKIIAQKKA